MLSYSVGLFYSDTFEDLRVLLLTTLLVPATLQSFKCAPRSGNFFKWSSVLHPARDVYGTSAFYMSLLDSSFDLRTCMGSWGSTCLDQSTYDRQDFGLLHVV